MYKIDTIHDAAMDAFVRAFAEGKRERWMAACAWWFFRQYIGNAQEFWSLTAAKLTTELPEADRLAIVAQLSKQEDALLLEAGEYPEMPQNVKDYVASWDPEEAEVDLNVARADAVAKVDREAETHRMNFITAGFGQVMTYQQKLEEARLVIANPSIDETEIPHIVAEAAVSGVDEQEKAAEIISTFDQWRLISSGIEKKRMAAKKAIAEAETADAVKVAGNVNWLDAPEVP